MVGPIKRLGSLKIIRNSSGKRNLRALALVPAAEAEKFFRDCQNIELPLGHQIAKRRRNVWMRGHNYTFSDWGKQPKMTENAGADEDHRVTAAAQPDWVVGQFFQRLQKLVD